MTTLPFFSSSFPFLLRGRGPGRGGGVTFIAFLADHQKPRGRRERDREKEGGREGGKNPSPHNEHPCIKEEKKTGWLKEKIGIK